MESDRIRFGSTDCSPETHQRLEKCLYQNKTLMHFELSKAAFSESALAEILSSLSENNTLIRLDLNNSVLTDSVSPALCRFLRKNHHLCLSFHNAEFTDGALSDIFDSMCENTTLHSLWFDNGKLSDFVSKTLCRFTRENNSVRGLMFAKARFTDAGLSEILLSLCENKSLQILSFAMSKLTDKVCNALCKFIEENNMLKYLRFALSTFSDDALSLMLAALTVNKTMQRLDQATDEACDAVSRFAKLNTTLCFLSFESAQFTNKGLTDILLSFCENKTLQALLFNRSAVTDASSASISRFIRENTSTRALCFGLATFTDAGVSAIVESFCETRTLLWLDFMMSELTDTSSEAICNCVRKSRDTRIISLTDAKFTDAAVIPVMHALSDNTSLLLFAFGESKLTDAVTGPLCKFLKQNNCIKLVSFTDAKFTDVAVSTIMENLAEDRTLKVLGVNNRSLTDAVSVALGRFIRENEVRETLWYEDVLTDEEFLQILQSNHNGADNSHLQNKSGDTAHETPERQLGDHSTINWEESERAFGPRKRVRMRECVQHPLREIKVEVREKHSTDAGTQTENEMESTSALGRSIIKTSCEKRQGLFQNSRNLWGPLKKSASRYVIKHVRDVEIQTQSCPTPETLSGKFEKRTPGRVHASNESESTEVIPEKSAEHTATTKPVQRPEEDKPKANPVTRTESVANANQAMWKSELSAHYDQYVHIDDVLASLHIMMKRGNLQVHSDLYGYTPRMDSFNTVGKIHDRGHPTQVKTSETKQQMHNTELPSKPMDTKTPTGHESHVKHANEVTMSMQKRTLLREFTEEGGVLKNPKTGVVLKVPPGAVPSGESLVVCVKVDTNLGDYKQWTDGKLECILGPVVECIASRDVTFQKPVILCIPLCTKPAKPSDINILYSTNEGFQDISKDVDMHCKIRDKTAQVYTKHFTQFLVNQGTSITIKDVLLTLAASRVNLEKHSRIELRLMSHLNCYSMKDFEDLRKRIYPKGMDDIDMQLVQLPEKEGNLTFPKVHIKLSIEEGYPWDITHIKEDGSRGEIVPVVEKEIDGRSVLYHPDNQGTKPLQNFFLKSSSKAQQSAFDLDVTFRYGEGPDGEHVLNIPTNFSIIYPGNPSTDESSSHVDQGTDSEVEDATIDVAPLAEAIKQELQDRQGELTGPTGFGVVVLISRYYFTKYETL